MNKKVKTTLSNMGITHTIFKPLDITLTNDRKNIINAMYRCIVCSDVHESCVIYVIYRLEYNAETHKYIENMLIKCKYKTTI